MGDNKYYSLEEMNTKTDINTNINTNTSSMRLKAIFLGDSSVGKTSLSHRIAEGEKYEFIEKNPSTIGIDFLTVPYVVAGNNIKVEIWDTAGQERFRSLIPSYYKSSDIIFVVFDPDNEDSIKDLDYWFGSIEIQDKKNEENFKYNPSKNKHNIYLLANKSDLWDNKEKFERNNTMFKEIQNKFENKYEISKVSAKNGENIQIIFKNAVYSAYFKKKSIIFNDINISEKDKYKKRFSIYNPSFLLSNNKNKNQNQNQKKCCN